MKANIAAKTFNRCIIKKVYYYYFDLNSALDFMLIFELCTFPQFVSQGFMSDSTVFILGLKRHTTYLLLKTTEKHTTQMAVDSDFFSPSKERKQKK